MINRLQLEQNIIRYSNIPFVATARGYWIDTNKETILLSQISTTYLKSCYDELKNIDNLKIVFDSLSKYMQEKVDEYNRSEFIYLKFENCTQRY